jgi:hypothetical protein
MDTLAVKNRIRDYLEDADERILRIINAIIESESDDYELSESHKEILDERLKHHEENPGDGKSWEEAIQKIRSKHKL